MHHSGSQFEPDTWEHRQSSFAQVPTTHWAFDIGFMHTSLVISTTALTLTGSNLASRSIIMSWTFAGIMWNCCRLLVAMCCCLIGLVLGQYLVNLWFNFGISLISLNPRAQSPNRFTISPFLCTWAQSNRWPGLAEVSPGTCRQVKHSVDNFPFAWCHCRATT